jgi:hypothetical protein
MELYLEPKPRPHVQVCFFDEHNSWKILQIEIHTNIWQIVLSKLEYKQPEEPEYQWYEINA